MEKCSSSLTASLNSMNFETLLVPDPQPHYLIEDVTLSSASSLRMLQAFHAVHSKGAGNLLLFGDAIAPNDDFPPLPKAAIEMESIQKHFQSGREQVFSRDQANPPVYLASKPERFFYIHFVAHGTASRLSPLDSAIVLSKTNAAKTIRPSSTPATSFSTLCTPNSLRSPRVAAPARAPIRAKDWSGFPGHSFAPERTT